MELFTKIFDVDFVDILEAYQERSSTIPMVAWLIRMTNTFFKYLKSSTLHSWLISIHFMWKSVLVSPVSQNVF